jgi:hypothetical protein
MARSRQKAVEQPAKPAATPQVKQAPPQSPEYNLLALLQDARVERQFQAVKYVLLGDDFLRKNLLFGAGAMATRSGWSNDPGYSQCGHAQHQSLSG